ncbi:MAG: glutamate-cysteine ligase family protein [Methanothrix sp.]|nr:glutamate-cysteine ligase family protein [Methanothrix sp.]MCX8207343.1 glutamate-cysteine ligase family protein [Methanothrix sp.]
MIGTEHEYSINDRSFNPLPISDLLIERLNGRVEHEIDFGDVRLSKELQKHVVELVPPPAESIAALESLLYGGVRRLYSCFGEHRFLGLGMHPLLTLDQTTFWEHDEAEYYHLYDRLFNIKQHGWLNIQALQINISYSGSDMLVEMFNRLRALLPYLIAVSAASPFVEGRYTGYMDNRLLFYMENQREIPEICNGVIPERIRSIRDYVMINRGIYRELHEKGADLLCREWVNSRGIIIRFKRNCLEIKAIDEQECIRSDMGVTAFISALLRSDISLEDEEESLREMMYLAIRTGTSEMKPELQKLYREAERCASSEERAYLPLIRERIDNGSLAEVLVGMYRHTGGMRAPLEHAERALRTNSPILSRE